MTIVSFKESRMSKRRHKPSDPRRIPDPAEAARRGLAPEAWGVNESALDLASNNDVALREGRGVEGKRRERYDIFALMHSRPGGTLSLQALLAVRRLQKDLAILHRTQGASDEPRTTGAGAIGALAAVTGGFSLVRVMAGDRVDEALAGMAGAFAERLTLRDKDGNVIKAPRFDPARPRPTYARLIRELCEFGFGPDLETTKASGEPTRDEKNRPIAPSATRPNPTPNWQAIVQKHTGERRHLAKYDHVRTAANDLAESYRRIDNEPKERVA